MLVSSLSTKLIDFLWCERTWSHGHSLCKLTPSTWPANGVYGHHLEVLEGHYHIHFCHDESTQGGVGKHCFIELLGKWIPHKTFCRSTVSYYSERSQFKLVLANTIKVTRATAVCAGQTVTVCFFAPLDKYTLCAQNTIFCFFFSKNLFSVLRYCQFPRWSTLVSHFMCALTFDTKSSLVCREIPIPIPQCASSNVPYSSIKKIKR